MGDRTGTEGLIKLIEQAIRAADTLAEQSHAAWMQQDAKMAADNLRMLLERARNGTLQKIKGAGLGITRALGEWAPKELYEAGVALESYYMDDWEPDETHF